MPAEIAETIHMTVNPDWAERGFLETTKTPKICNIYVSNDDGRAVVASCYNWGGASVEIPDRAGVCAFDDDLSLERAIVDSLRASTIAPKHLNLRTQKPSDWPAFKASGERTIRAFEAEYRRLSVTGNATNITFICAANVEDALHDLQITAMISCGRSVREMGQFVRYVFGRLELANKTLV